MSASKRLDNFTDAAFAFAVTLVVIGGGAPSRTADDLMRAVADIPAFAMGFALLAMFWFGHVQWRRLAGDAGGRSVILTILLVFLVLLYVHPLRMVAFSLSPSSGVSAVATRFLWVVYGLGFAAMAATLSALFAGARADPTFSAERLLEIRANMYVYAILAATGILSAVCAIVPGLIKIAPWVYATLPLSIGLFSHWYSRKVRGLLQV